MAHVSYECTSSIGSIHTFGVVLVGRYRMILLPLDSTGSIDATMHFICELRHLRRFLVLSHPPFQLNFFKESLPFFE